MRRLRLPSPSMVVASLALAVALGGTGYAAATLARNSVGAAQIRAGAVRSSDVKDGALLARDFKRGQMPRGETGATGPRGPQGPAGPAGPATQATIANGSIGPDQLGAAPAVRLFNDAPQSITPGAAQQIAVNEDYDPDGLHTPGDFSQIVVRRTGIYLLTGYVTWAANTTGLRSMALIADGATIAGQSGPPAPTGGTTQSASGVVRLDAGDTAFLGVMQTSGGLLNVASAAFSATYLSRAG